MGVYVRPTVRTRSASNMTGQFGRERSLVKLHAGAWGTRSRQAHQKQESRSTSVRRPVGSSQVKEWKDDEPLF